MEVFKIYLKKTASDKILHGKVFNIGKSPTYDGYQRGLSSMVYIFLDKYYVSLILSVNAHGLFF